MNIKLKPVWIALALASTGALAAPVNDWYVGAGGGWAIAHDLGDFGKDASKDATALTLFGGYNFTENLGGELGYLSTGDWDVQGTDFSSKGATLCCRWGITSCSNQGFFLSQKVLRGEGCGSGNQAGP